MVLVFSCLRHVLQLLLFNFSYLKFYYNKIFGVVLNDVDYHSGWTEKNCLKYPNISPIVACKLADPIKINLRSLVTVRITPKKLNQSDWESSITRRNKSTGNGQKYLTCKNNFKRAFLLFWPAGACFFVTQLRSVTLGSELILRSLRLRSKYYDFSLDCLRSLG